MSTPLQLRLDSVVYTSGEAGAWSLQLGWTPLQLPTSSYWTEIQLYDSPTMTTPVGSAVQVTTPNASGGVWSTTAAGATLDPSAIYWISVRSANAASDPTQLGPPSTPLPVLYQGSPTLAGVAYLPPKVTVVWTPPPGINLIGTYTVFIRDSGGHTLAALDGGGLGFPAAKPADASFLSFDVSDVPLEAAMAPLSLTLASTYRDPATGGVSYGPSDTAALLAIPPRVASAIFAGGSVGTGLSYTVAVAGQMVKENVPPQFLAVVRADGIPVYSTSGAATINANGLPQITLTMPQRLPFFYGLAGAPPAMRLTVELSELDGISTGPPGPPAPLLVEAPTITGLRYVPGDPTGVGATGTVMLELAYPPGSDEGAVRVQVHGQGGGLADTGNLRGTSGGMAVRLHEGQTYTLSVAALAGQSVGPPGPSLQLVTAVPQLVSASFDGMVARAAWTAVDPTTQPGVTGYRAWVSSGGPEIAGVTVSGTAAALAVPGGGGSLALQVAAVAGASQGPPCAAAALLGAAVGGFAAQTDPITALTTLTWAALPGVDGYSVQLLAEGLPAGDPVATTAETYTLPQPLSPNTDQAVEVAGTQLVGGATLTGPYSPPFTLPTTQPTVLGVDYGGGVVTVAWDPAPGATGYTVTVAEGTSPTVTVVKTASAPAGSLGTSFGFTAEGTPAAYSVVVQALVAGSSGPPTDPVPLVARGWQVSTQTADVAYPNVVPADSLLSGPVTLATYLAGYGALTALPLTQGAFTLDVNGDAATQASFPYTLTIAQSTTPSTSDPWVFTSQAIRTGIQADYVAFLKGAEGKGAGPQMVSALQEAISRLMPQTFAESLYYAYGLDLVAGTADLRPGMVVRVAFSEWLEVPADPQPPLLSGYAGGAVVDYDVGSCAGPNGWAVGLDAFIAQLVAGGALAVAAPEAQPQAQLQAGAADAADLFYPGFLQPFYRMFVPSPLAPTSEVGSAYTSTGFVLAAAASYTALTGTVSYPATGSSVAYFRGRAVVKLCVRVWVDGVPEVVPIGTTLGNVLERYGQRLPAAAVPLGALTLERAMGQVVFDSAAPTPGGTHPVRLGGATLAVYAPGVDATSLPLLHGDRVTLPG